jgi:uncharacterized membrane protein
LEIARIEIINKREYFNFSIKRVLKHYSTTIIGISRRNASFFSSETLCPMPIAQ